jgi:hypothetical protein
MRRFLTLLVAGATVVAYLPAQDAAAACAKRPDGACIPRMQSLPVAPAHVWTFGRESALVLPTYCTDWHVYGLGGRPYVQERGGFYSPNTLRRVVAYSPIDRTIRPLRRVQVACWKA